jgi:hypothetical protein
MLVNPSPVVIDGSVPRLRTLKTLAFASVLAPLLLFLAYAAVSYSAAFRGAEGRAQLSSTGSCGADGKAYNAELDAFMATIER